MNRNPRSLVTAAALSFGGGCALEARPPLAVAESLSTLYSYHGRIELHETTFGHRIEASFFSVNPANNCDRFGVLDFVRPATGLIDNVASVQNACTALGVDQYNTLNNPADLSTCTSYTAAFQVYGCRDGFGNGGAGQYFNNVCDVAVTSTPRTRTTGTPAFVVRSISYQVPGNRSRIAYVAGDSNGSTWETRISDGQAAEVRWSPIIRTGDSAGVAFKLQHDTTTKLSLQRSSTRTETLTFASDITDHNRDVISLWINLRLDHYDPCTGHDAILQYGVTNPPWVNPAFDPTLPVMMDFTVGELLHPETVTDFHRSLFLSRLTQDDIRTRILALDPFVDQTTWAVVANPVLDSNRFRPVQGGTCPRNLSDAVTVNRSITCQAQYNEVLDTLETFNRAWSYTTGLTILELSFPRSYTVSYSRTVTSSTGNNNSAEITLATSTPGICISGQLAVDTMFNVYVMSSFQFACATLR